MKTHFNNKNDQKSAIALCGNIEEYNEHGDGELNTSNHFDDIDCEKCLSRMKTRGIVRKPSTEISTDCRSETGVTVGLVDSIITSLRILKTRDLTSFEVSEAIKDLRGDEDLKFLIKGF